MPPGSPGPGAATEPLRALSYYWKPPERTTCLVEWTYR
jgi:hypothetical protein